jgi:hypothetical protein
MFGAGFLDGAGMKTGRGSQLLDLRRRAFLSLLGGAAGWPFVARARADEVIE